MNKKASCLALVLLALLPLIALAPDALIGRAAWSEGTGYNLASWESYNATNWKGNYTASECYINYTQNVDNFQLWSFSDSLTNFYFTGLLGLSQIRQQVYFRIQDRNNVSRYFEGSLSQFVSFGVFGTLTYTIGWSIPDAVVLLARQTNPIGDLAININITKWTNTQMNIEVSHLYETNKLINTHRSIIVPLGFFNNVTLSMWVYKRLQLGAVGWVQGSKTGESIKSGSSLSSLGGSQWGAGVLDFKISTWPSITSLVTPGIILGGVAGVFAVAGSKLGGHGVAGFMIGGCIALVMLAQSGLMPSWLFAVIVLIGAVGIYFWWK